MSTYMANAKTVEPQWLLVDASGKTLGRLATQIAMRLRGKHKPEFTPHADTGDYVIVTNVDKLIVTGKKFEDKLYHHHTGYPGGLKTTNFKELHSKAPARVLEFAVKGMLPKGPLGRQIFRKLKIYAGVAHPHAAQQPSEVDL